MSHISSMTRSMDANWMSPSSSDRIEDHIAWKGAISESAVERLLNKQGSYTFILRKEKNGDYGVAFVEENGSVHYQNFKVERGIITYRNWCGGGQGHRNIMPFLAQLMNCKPTDCRPLMV